MAYNKNELTLKAIEVIKKKKLVFMTEVIHYLGISNKSFYNHELNEVSEIKNALQGNKISLKGKMRSKWFISENATLQISLYKLIANDDERKRLTQQYIKHDGEVNHKNQIDATKLKSETLRDLFENGIVENDNETS